jgi:energy-coupling factor transporter ATP-binding protein EcfA2
MALAQFEGTLVVVSHDRHLLRATTDEFIIVADGRLQPFDGDLDDYKDWLFKTKLGKGTESVSGSAPAGAAEGGAHVDDRHDHAARHRHAADDFAVRRKRSSALMAAVPGPC